MHPSRCSCHVQVAAMNSLKRVSALLIPAAIIVSFHSPEDRTHYSGLQHHGLHRKLRKTVSTSCSVRAGTCFCCKVSALLQVGSFFGRLLFLSGATRLLENGWLSLTGIIDADAFRHLTSCIASELSIALLAGACIEAKLTA